MFCLGCALLIIFHYCCHHLCNAHFNIVLPLTTYFKILLFDAKSFEKKRKYFTMFTTIMTGKENNTGITNEEKIGFRLNKL